QEQRAPQSQSSRSEPCFRNPAAHSKRVVTSCDSCVISHVSWFCRREAVMAGTGAVPPAQGGGCLSGAVRAVGERVAMLSGGDRAIAARVAQAVRSVPGVPSAAISVESWRGHVTLRGQLPSKDLANAAVEAARAVRGVTQIDNFLRTP